MLSATNTMLSTTLRSWRTLPGHSQASSFLPAGSETPLLFPRP